MAKARPRHTEKSAKRKRIEASASRSLCSLLQPVFESTEPERIGLGNGVFLYSEGHLTINT